jgi:NAD(P)-dependent dehydrogenase (short-subunit alcohol dehydrogenase family)
LASPHGVNLIAPYLIRQAALSHLRKFEGSTIVNIASGHGLLPSAPNSSGYAASKGGLIAFGKALAAELAPLIRVNSICPGIVGTPKGAPFFKGYANASGAPFV